TPDELTTVLNTPDRADHLPAARLDAGTNPSSADAHLRHALAALQNNHPDEASQAIRRCADAAPSWERPALRRRLAAIAETRGDPDSARLIQAFDTPTHQDEQPAQ